MGLMLFLEGNTLHIQLESSFDEGNGVHM